MENSNGNCVTLSREEYDDLVANTTILGVVTRIIITDDNDYGKYEILRKVIGIDDDIISKLEVRP